MHYGNGQSLFCLLFLFSFFLEKKKKGCLNNSMTYLMDCLGQLAYIKSVSVTFIQSSWLIIKSFLSLIKGVTLFSRIKINTNSFSNEAIRRVVHFFFWKGKTDGILNGFRFYL